VPVVSAALAFEDISRLGPTRDTALVVATPFRKLLLLIDIILSTPLILSVFRQKNLKSVFVGISIQVTYCLYQS
jgi:hypothetical protein